MKEAVAQLRVRVGIKNHFPDPAKIDVAGEWYFLDHVSSGLVHFNHNTGRFEGLLAEEPWISRSSGVHTFTLRKDAKFSDGTSIRAQDVEASIKRLLVKKTSTHFPLWEYIEDCENLKSITDPCSGVKALDDRTIEIRLREQAESFYLQLASPETGIWAKDDLLRMENEFRPSKFSGPYSVVSFDEKGAVLKRNELNPLSKQFPLSPREMHFLLTPLDKSNQALIEGQLDLVMRSRNPFREPDWNGHGISVFESSPSTIAYFSGTDLRGRKLIGQDFLKALWEKSVGDEAYPADTFLPFNRGYSLKRPELLSEFPEHSAENIKVAVPWTWFSDGFLNLILEAGKKVGMKIEFIRLDREAWARSLERADAGKDFDYVLVPYVASERYPAVQLRYITGPVKKAPIDLKKAESPELNHDKVGILKDYQRWLLSGQHVVPLYFLRSQIIFNSQLDIGDQPPSDAEIELWRVIRK